MESELSDREKLGSEMAETVKFLKNTQDSVKADVSEVEPTKLEEKMKDVKHSIEVRMELVLQEIRKQEEKYADMTDMPSGKALSVFCYPALLTSQVVCLSA